MVVYGRSVKNSCEKEEAAEPNGEEEDEEERKRKMIMRKMNAALKEWKGGD